LIQNKGRGDRERGERGEADGVGGGGERATQ